MVQVKLKIADVVIQFRSKSPLEKRDKNDFEERYQKFFYSGGRAAQIIINVHVTDKLPNTDGEVIFVTTHYLDHSENWRLIKKNNTFIYLTSVEGKEQAIFFNQKFNRVDAYLLSKKQVHSWHPSDIIYDFLQVLLITYFTARGEGIFTHSVGIKDINREGLIFTGKSGCGKSTTARIWHRYSGAKVLNDDRIIIRRRKNKFIIYGSPWHGDFSDYLESVPDSAELKKLFFIRHAPRNSAQKINPKEAFKLLYPAFFAPFWNKKALGNATTFSIALLKSVPAYRLGFAKGRKIIGFVRRIVRNHA